MGTPTVAQKKVFLGGTCNNSLWRDLLTPKLKIDYFNPVVENWDEEKQRIEDIEKTESDYCLYVLTPKSDSPYSIAEVVDDSNKRPAKVIFCFLETTEDGSYTDHQRKALTKVGKLVEKNGGKFLKTLDEVANYLNNN